MAECRTVTASARVSPAEPAPAAAVERERWSRARDTTWVAGAIQRGGNVRIERIPDVKHEHRRRVEPL